MVASDERECGATVRRDDQTNPGSKPIKTTTYLFGNILCLELYLLSSQYLKTNIHQSLSHVSGRLPDLHRPSASDFFSSFVLAPNRHPAVSAAWFPGCIALFVKIRSSNAVRWGGQHKLSRQNPTFHTVSLVSHVRSPIF